MPAIRNGKPTKYLPRRPPSGASEINAANPYLASSRCFPLILFNRIGISRLPDMTHHFLRTDSLAPEEHCPAIVRCEICGFPITTSAFDATLQLASFLFLSLKVMEPMFFINNNEMLASSKYESRYSLASGPPVDNGNRNKVPGNDTESVLNPSIPSKGRSCSGPICYIIKQNIPRNRL